MFASEPIKKIFAKDKKSVYLWCNADYAKDFNLTPKQIYGKTDFDLYPKALAQKYIKDDKKVLTTGRTYDYREEYLLQQNTIHVHTVKTPTLDDQGKITGLVGFFWDFTQEVINQKKNEESRLELEKINHFVIGRELKMIELKDKIKQLETNISINHSPQKKLSWSEKFIQFSNLEDDITSILKNQYLQKIESSTLPKLKKISLKKNILLFIKENSHHKFLQELTDPEVIKIIRENH